jgi:hypothetical protein
MFAMRYCRKCLEGFKPETEHLADDDYLMLNIPVEDSFGVILRARMTIMNRDFLNLLESDADVVDLSQHATMMGVEIPESPATAHLYH